MIDRSIFECFIDGGARSVTQTFFPTEPLTQMTLSTAYILDDMEISIAVYALQSAWVEYENEDGIVEGNGTDRSDDNDMMKRYMGYKARFQA